MDHNDHSAAHDQGADPFGLNPLIAEFNNNNNNNANSPLSNNSQQQSQNAPQDEHNELIASSCGSNAILQLQGLAPEILAAITSPPLPPPDGSDSPPQPTDATSTDVTCNNNSLENAPGDMATVLGTRSIVTDALEFDAEYSDPDAEINEDEDKNSVEAEVTEQGGGDDLNSIDQQQSSASSDHQVGPHGQLQNQDNIGDTAGEYFTTLMNQMNAKRLDKVIDVNHDIADNSNNSSGPQLIGLNSPANLQQFLPSPLPAAPPQPTHQHYAPPPLGNYAGNNWPNNNRIIFQQPSEGSAFASFQYQFIRPSSPLALGIRSPSARDASPVRFSSAAPVPIFSVGMSTGYDVGQVQARPFGRPYEQPNHTIYSYQHNNSEHLSVSGINSAPNPIMSHRYGGANSRPQMVLNMTSGNFPLGNTQQQPILYPSGSFPRNSTTMTSGGMGVPNQSFTQLMNSIAYWPQQQLSNNYQPHPQLSNQNASMANNNVVYDLNVQYAAHHGRFVPSRPQNISSASSSYQQQVNHQPPALQPDSAPCSALAGENVSEQLDVAPNATDIHQRRHPVIPRPAIFSRSHITGNRLQRFLPGSASSNVNGTNSSDINVLNSQPIQQRETTMLEMPGHFQLARATQRQFEDIGESSTSSKRSRMEAVLEASNENRDDSPAPDAPETILANLRAALQVQENNNNQADHSSVASSSRPANPRTNRVNPMPNSLYDPEYERLGLPIDPFLRMFALSNWNKERK